MLKLTWIEFFLRVVPEAFIMVWGIYVMSKEPINRHKYIICSIASALITFFVRYLPIHFGVHTIISTVFLVCILIIVGIPLLKSIYGVIITTLLILVGEMLNMLLFNIFNMNIESAFGNPFVKCLFEIPSLIFVIIVICIIRFLLNKKAGVNGVHN